VTDSATQPSVWVLEGIKAGDNAQMVAVAEALGWPWVAKPMRYRPWELVTNLLLRLTLAGLERSSKAALTPPWPDLVLTAGRRNEPVARWIRRSAMRGTGHRDVKLVHLGRPWARPEQFDLVVSTPQYEVRGDNVIVNDLPLHRVSEARLSEAAERWAPRFADLPRPYVVALVGGSSGAYVFTRAKARQLGTAVNRQARELGGSALVTTSARTPRNAVAELRSCIDVAHYLFDWYTSPREENPYLGFLALGDRFVVTGESMSMLTEACATGRPVQIFDLGLPAPGETGKWWLDARSYGWRPMTHRLAQWLGPKRMRRDVGRIRDRLVETGRAVLLGESVTGGASAPSRDLERTVEAIRALF
jgi:mitochondrial fission protein ELM1